MRARILISFSFFPFAEQDVQDVSPRRLHSFVLQGRGSHQNGIALLLGSQDGHMVAVTPLEKGEVCEEGEPGPPSRMAISFVFLFSFILPTVFFD